MNTYLYEKKYKWYRHLAYELTASDIFHTDRVFNWNTGEILKGDRAKWDRDALMFYKPPLPMDIGLIKIQIFTQGGIETVPIVHPALITKRLLMEKLEG